MKIAIDFVLDTDTGDYDVCYRNMSNPGGLIDFTKTMRMLRKVLVEHEADTEEDAAWNKTGQAKIVRGNE